MSSERWNELKKIAETAMKDRKVFMIKGGGFPAVRRALIQRGWIEKYESHKVIAEIRRYYLFIISLMYIIRYQNKRQTIVTFNNCDSLL